MQTRIRARACSQCTRRCTLMLWKVDKALGVLGESGRTHTPVAVFGLCLKSIAEDIWDSVTTSALPCPTFTVFSKRTQCFIAHLASNAARVVTRGYRNNTQTDPHILCHHKPFYTSTPNICRHLLTSTTTFLNYRLKSRKQVSFLNGTVSWMSPATPLKPVNEISMFFYLFLHWKFYIVKWYDSLQTFQIGARTKSNCFKILLGNYWSKYWGDMPSSMFVVVTAPRPTTTCHIGNHHGRRDKAILSSHPISGPPESHPIITTLICTHGPLLCVSWPLIWLRKRPMAVCPSTTTVCVYFLCSD